MSWIEKCEKILDSFGLPYYFQHFTCEKDQLPDNYIVYSLVHDPGVTWADGKETSHEPQIRVCLYYRDKSIFVTISEKIEKMLMEAGFGRGSSRTIRYQTDIGRYGWRCDFYYYERR